MPAPVAEVEIGEGLVRRLLAEQCADLAHLPLVLSGEGWDNVQFRLGDALAVRLPRRAMSAPLILHEQRWLPELAPHLPLPIPVPLRVGRPGHGYPWTWSVVPWIDGEVIERRPPDDWAAAAQQLGELLAALHQPAPPDAPVNPYRGTPLSERSERLRSGLDAIEGLVDRPAVEALWAELVATAPYEGPPLWLHGDLHPLNILVADGRVSGVIDFGDITAGDRATDLALAWIVLPAAVREVFRFAAGAHLPIDDHTWARARAWALAHGIACLGGDDRVAGFGARSVAEALRDPR